MVIIRNDHKGTNLVNNETKLLMHGFLPNTMMVTIIVPIIKNKSGDLSDINNIDPCHSC